MSQSRWECGRRLRAPILARSARLGAPRLLPLSALRAAANLCAGILLLISAASAQDLQPVPPARQAAVWDDFETAHRSFTNITAHVVQSKYLRILQEPIVSEANLWFQRPGLFRWEVVKPAPSLALCDGKSFWMYYPEFHQAERYPLDALRLGSNPLKVITASLGENPAWLTNLCDVAVYASPERYRLEAVPRDAREKQFVAKLILDFLRHSFVLERTVMESKNGDRTESRFLDSHINGTLDPSLFRFEPPPGVKVVSPFTK